MQDKQKKVKVCHFSRHWPTSYRSRVSKDKDEGNIAWTDTKPERPSSVALEEFLFGLKRQRVKWEHEKSVDSFWSIRIISAVDRKIHLSFIYVSFFSVADANIFVGCPEMLPRPYLRRILGHPTATLISSLFHPPSFTGIFFSRVSI